jgi:pre-mRNA-processing factor 6
MRLLVLIELSPEIWIAAARLEDTQGNESRVDIVVKNAVKILTDLGSNLEREKWINEAEKCEVNGFPLTCQVSCLYT